MLSYGLDHCVETLLVRITTRHCKPLNPKRIGFSVPSMRIDLHDVNFNEPENRGRLPNGIRRHPLPRNAYQACQKGGIVLARFVRVGARAGGHDAR